MKRTLQLRAAQVRCRWPSWTLERVAVAMMVVSGVIILGRQVHTSFVQLAQEEAEAARKGSVLVLTPGDVSIRDIPKVREFLHGRFFSDPHYQGEANWYPFAYPLLVAGWCRITGSEITHGYFVLEIILGVALFVVAAVAILRMGGVSSLWLLPVAVWMGWLVPAPAAYPAETARIPLCLCFLLAGSVQRDIYRGHERRWPVWGLGVGVGLLGVWHGASFFASLVMIGMLTLWDLGRAIAANKWRARLVVWATAHALALAILATLLVPQLVRYGHIEQPNSARLYLPEIYEGGRSFAKALTLSTCPKGVPGFLALAFLLLMLSRAFRQRFPRLRNFGTPLAAAYLFCELMGLAGFGLYDPEHPVLASLLQRFLPAPPPTFFLIALWSFSFLVYCAGLLALVSVATWLIVWCGRRFSWAVPLSPYLTHRIGLIASTLAFIALIPTFPLGQPRHSETEERGLVDFGKKAEAVVGDGTILMRWPFRLLRTASPRILLTISRDHSNHYAQAARIKAVNDLDSALTKGLAQVADAILDGYDVRALVEDAGSRDLVVSKCAGAVLAQHGQYRLRERRRCRP